MTADDDKPSGPRVQLDESQLFEQLMEAGRQEEPPQDLAERVLGGLQYRSRLVELAPVAPSGGHRGWGTPSLLVFGAAMAAGVTLWLSRGDDPPPIVAEATPALGSAQAAPSGSVAWGAAQPAADPCLARHVASGSAPLLDDFEDGDDAILGLEQRVGFWRWVREFDAPGTAPALIGLPRPSPTPKNKLAVHVKGARLSDWGATIDFRFIPACYDASAYAGIAFQARGPGRIYLAPREVNVIPVAEGGLCDVDCHNAHVAKVELTDQWRDVVVRWDDLRQRGIGKPPLDPSRLHGIAFLVRPEDTPYDVWLDQVRFVPKDGSGASP
ncbi:MAG TPA: hypothetical protein VER33_24770 [Polyangiaceae bacterium]|nr:hypothetical protein [Polyangiaceae bacterium]